MAELAVRPTGLHGFVVTVDDAGASTRHEVTVPEGLTDTLGIEARDEEELVRASFEFLLAREPPTSILRQFDLDVIERYFPGYVDEMRQRFV